MRLPEAPVYKKISNYVKIYPTSVRLYEYKTETYKKVACLDPEPMNIGNNNGDETSLERSIRRSKTLISDLVLCNKFDLFATFTFAKDRQDLRKCKDRMSKWLDNQRVTNKSLKYLIVPEFHKDGKSIHFHALIQKFDESKLIYSGVIQRGRQVYNIKNYKNGFTTAVKIDNIEKVSSYVKKYITKDMPHIPNKKRFWVSKNLTRPQIKYNYSTEPIKKQLMQVYENEVLTISHANISL